MREYSVEIERQMKWFYRSLSEKDRRRYAAVDAEKLGFGGVEYVSRQPNVWRRCLGPRQA